MKKTNKKSIKEEKKIQCEDEEEEEYSFIDHYRISQIIHYLRVLPNLGINEVIEAKIRTLASNYIVACIENTKQALFVNRAARHLVFTDRKLAIKESHKYHVRILKEETVPEEDDNEKI